MVDACGFLRVVEDFHVAVRAAVDQRGVAEQGLAALADLQQLGQLAEGPPGQALVLAGLGRGQRRRLLGGQGCRLCRGLRGHPLERLLRLPAQLGAQLGQVAAHLKLAAVLVDHLEVHRMVRGQRFQLEIGPLDHGAGLLADIGDQHIQQLALAKRLARDKARGILRQRHAVAAQLLRQRLEQQVHLLPDHARHQPVSALLAHLVECVQRHGQGHAVAVAAWLEVVSQPHVHPGHVHGLGEQVGGDAGRLVPHQLVAVQVQQLAVPGALGLVPLLEGGLLADVGGNRAIVEGVDQFVVDQHVLAARLVLEVLDLAHQALVVRIERQARIELALDQRAADKDLARFLRVHRAVVHAAVLVDHQPVQRGALQRQYLARLLFPVRIAPADLEQVAAHLFQPFRLDARQRAREQPAGLDQLGRDNPAPDLARDQRARPQVELDAARAQVFAALAVAILDAAADIAQQAGQQRLVHLLIGGLAVVQAPALLGHRGQQLRMHVAPLAQPQV
ncbi:hypothetical protein D9M72_385480 [compost metagenome]